MSNKDEIISKVQRNIKNRFDMPSFEIEAIKFPDKQEQFINISKGVGGVAYLVKKGEDINELIQKLYPEAKKIASNLDEIKIATVNPDEIPEPHSLNGIELSIVRGKIGVAENGCVWIPQEVRHKVIYFICEYLVILLDRNEIVNNMHEAYAYLESKKYGFGVFISGPSKTADIEQSLVVGAHGAKGVTILLT